MAATEPTGEEVLAEQAGTAFAEGNCAQALELLVQLQKQREDGALLLPPPTHPATWLAVETGLIVWAWVRCGCPLWTGIGWGRTARNHPCQSQSPDRAARVRSCGQTPRFCTTRPFRSMC